MKPGPWGGDLTRKAKHSLCLKKTASEEREVCTLSIHWYRVHFSDHPWPIFFNLYWKTLLFSRFLVHENAYNFCLFLDTTYQINILFFFKHLMLKGNTFFAASKTISPFPDWESHLPEISPSMTFCVLSWTSLMLPWLISWAFLCQNMVKKDREKNCLPEGVVRKKCSQRCKKQKRLPGKIFHNPIQENNVPSITLSWRGKEAGISSVGPWSSLWAQLFKARLSQSWISGNFNCYLFTVNGGFLTRIAFKQKTFVI